MHHWTRDSDLIAASAEYSSLSEDCTQCEPSHTCLTFLSSAGQWRDIIVCNGFRGFGHHFIMLLVSSLSQVLLHSYKAA